MSTNSADSPDISPVTCPEDNGRRAAVESACINWQQDLQLFLLGILRNKHLVDDTWQRTVVSALQSSSTVRLPTLRGWLFQIALNEARKTLKESRKTPRPANAPPNASGYTSAPHHQTPEPAPDHIAILQETRTLVQNCLANLPPEQQEVIRQRIYLGRTFSEIATSLNLPLGTVLTWCRRGILKLKEDPRLKDLMND